MNTPALMITVPLSSEVRRIAQSFQSHQVNPHKSQQVYYHTLAVFAVNHYLQDLGFLTELEASDSWNPLMQTLMDVADLQVKHHGKLECRFVKPNAQSIYIPAEIWWDRIGCIAVELSESCDAARLLGFLESADTENIPLTELRSLSELPNVLRNSQPITDLSQWFDRGSTAIWQSVEAVLSDSPLYLLPSFRKNTLTPENLIPKRAKLIHLGHQSIILLVALLPQNGETVTVRVRLHPTEGETYLPEGLELCLLSEVEQELCTVCTRSSDNFIQLPSFDCTLGERFCVRLQLNEVDVRENFLF